MCLLELAAKNEVNGDIAQERTGTVATFGRGAWRSNRAARMAAKGASSPAELGMKLAPQGSYLGQRKTAARPIVQKRLVLQIAEPSRQT